MTKFVCKVRTPQGQIVKIKMEEKDKISCLKKLKKNGMTPISIETPIQIPLNNKKTKKVTATIHAKKKKRFIIPKTIFNKELINKVTADEVKEFTNDLYILLKSNFTKKHALITIINKVENTYFKAIIKRMLDSVEQEKYIYKIMKEYKNIFPFVYINFIKTGELTDSLEESLTYAITYLEEENKIKTKVKNILVPNIAVFIGIIILLIFSLVIVIPNLQNIFQSYGINVYLPRFLTIMSLIIKKLLEYWYIVGLIIAIIIGLFIRFISSDKGKYKFDNLLYNNFLFGKLFFLMDISRVIRSILLNLQNKMRLQDALEISKNITKNTRMIEIIEKSINNVYLGKSWFDSFEEEKILNPIILELLKKGTKIKSLHTMQIAVQYIDKEIEKEINRVLKILPEISYVLVGIALLIAIFVILIPCMEIYLGGFLFI